jgi:hypothetical protein
MSNDNAAITQDHVSKEMRASTTSSRASTLQEVAAGNSDGGSYPPMNIERFTSIRRKTWRSWSVASFQRYMTSNSCRQCIGKSLPRLVERNVVCWSTGESNRCQRAPNRVRSRSMEDVLAARYPTPGMVEERRSLHLSSAAISHVLRVTVGATTATTCCHAGTASHKQNKQHC